ncbi:ribose transport system substrate-binding protein [Paenibacillus sp. yr247]|uniref:sugar ABC transporter substrate-binding protein n=1 Tax=Paenibacillus sp. yr247 TaxID=1761880 RepID=UPI000888CE64|nr:sugar ABC transporter substrate-binding protein [Paenibacillus sp. yr247]SDO48386.1 ribose transport system substrate-binding protein [Paenibacillus sp. yr247]
MKKNALNRNKYAALLLVLTSTLIFAGCGNHQATPVISQAKESPKAASKEITIGFVVKTMDNPYFQLMNKGAQKAADELGVKLVWKAGQNSTDVAAQLNIVQDLNQQHVSAIVIAPIGPEAIVPAIDKANANGIPVVIVDTRANGGKIVSFIGYENLSTAAEMGKFVVDALHGKGEVGILEGSRGQSTTEERLQGYHKALDKEPGIKVVASQTANYSQDQGFTVTQNMIQAHPDIDFIIGSNDEMALGAIRAIQNAGKSGKIRVVGFNATPLALQAVKKGEMLATISNHPDKEGYLSVKTALEALKGNVVEATQMVTTEIVTAKNVDEFLK